ncbi:uncharacterized protein BP5553_06474 [Venustampulla echinocandica]|uniref:Zn(2)-C6 fungal-type domain-containing protein n=1 Tax=Venustampulla echinocandica TaxID=2656787 RepID=A0A370TK13_9HELO|nr:uncharacterized protein BP5553_06474 [Venustampulla echinocandica]RDL35862.1 hypothetical protein BP5553_06474 [Venustampulla echinocandica]
MGPANVDLQPPKAIGTHTEGTDAPIRALQVCSHCKSIKKGCDKKLPRCSQCIKRRAVCRYSEPSSPRRYGDEIVVAVPAIEPSGSSTSWTSIPKPIPTRSNPCIQLSMLLMNSISDVMQPKGSSLPISTDAVFHSQVCNIIRADGQYVEDIVTKYFNGVHGWLPIISKTRFYDMFRSSQTAPMADFSILLLAMRLIIQHPSPDPDDDRDREILYLATKTLLAQAQSFTPSSLRLIQAGIIVAHYEQANGMVDAGYVTIGTCARMAIAIGMQNPKCSEAPLGSDSWTHDEEVLSTWWGLVICDSIIASNPRMAGRPLAWRPIRHNDYLPLEADELVSHATKLMNLEPRYFVSSTLPRIGMFGGEAQAIYLLQKVRLAINERQVNAETLMTLGRELQNLLTANMNQPTGRWCHYSPATKILIVAMYTLNRAASNATDIDHRSDCVGAIRVTLDTITRMVIDIAHAFNKECHTFDIETFPPSVADIVQCAQEHILMCQDFGNEQWIQDFEALRKMLQYFNKRWTLAGQELCLLDNAVESTMQKRQQAAFSRCT